MVIYFVFLIGPEMAIIGQIKKQTGVKIKQNSKRALCTKPKLPTSCGQHLVNSYAKIEPVCVLCVTNTKHILTYSRHSCAGSGCNFETQRLG